MWADGQQTESDGNDDEHVDDVGYPMGTWLGCVGVVEVPGQLAGAAKNKR